MATAQSLFEEKIAGGIERHGSRWPQWSEAIAVGPRAFVEEIDDRHDFLARLGRVAQDFGLRVYAWSLLSNHAHLLTRTGDIGLSRCMHRLLAGYAGHFNRRYQRSGYLFQNRFKSILVDQHAYLLELVRYIHLNPVRAGVVALDALDTYPWSGHAALLDAAEVPPWFDAETVLAQFSPNRRAAAVAYREFVRTGMGTAVDLPPENGIARRGDRWSVGPSAPRGREAWAFVERVAGSPAFIDIRRHSLTPPSPGAPRQRIAVDHVLRETARRFGLQREELLSGGRSTRLRQARNAALRDLVRYCELSFTQSGQLLGISKWTVGRALKP